MHLHLVIFSGGMDSFTLLHKVHDLVEEQGAYSKVEAISFDYSQRHQIELKYAAAETQRLGIEHQVVSLHGIAPLLQGSALTSPGVAVPEGHYADESMRKTVVPGRNTLMLSLAMAYAESKLLQNKAAEVSVYYGAHSGDHAIYPDCRPDYIEAMQKVFHKATGGKVRLRAPFTYMNKLGILAVGRDLGLTAEDYARSYTCYNGQPQACGVCGSCVERREAFELMGWVDPATRFSVT